MAMALSDTFYYCYINMDILITSDFFYSVNAITEAVRTSRIHKTVNRITNHKDTGNR